VVATDCDLIRTTCEQAGIRTLMNSSDCLIPPRLAPGLRLRVSQAGAAGVRRGHPQDRAGRDRGHRDPALPGTGLRSQDGADERPIDRSDTPADVLRMEQTLRARQLTDALDAQP